jgi:general nucleoside transport system permease protein
MIRLRLERRVATPRWLRVAVPLLSIVVALVLAAIFFLLTDRPPVRVYSEMFGAAFGDMNGIKDTLVSATPLVFAGLAAAFAMRMGLYNIGGEGQLYAGAIAASGAALLWTADMSAPFAIATVFAAGAVGGMVWMLVPALARARLGTSEIVTTLMMVLVADVVLDYLISGSTSYWRDPLTFGFPQGKEIPDSAQFARWFDSRITVALPIALFTAVVVWFVNKRTSFGYAQDVIGDAPHAARYAGISERRTVLVTLLISGSLAGMAGAVEIGARIHKLEPSGLRLGLGFTGIVIAALARSNALGVLIAAFFIGGLRNAGDSVQAVADLDLPKSVALMLQGFVVLCFLGGQVFATHRLRVVRTSISVAEVAA